MSRLLDSRQGLVAGLEAGLKIAAVMLLVLGTVSVSEARDAPPTPRSEEILLSGTGPSDAVPWRFVCRAAGRNDTTPRGCGRWTTIDVPSVWEQQGFGAYDYGHDEDKHDEIGLYRRSFTVPADWRGRRIELVFDGVMTDASVRVDGQAVGPVHRGGFYRFRRDVTDVVEAGATHELEVAVSKISADASVEAAERDADYWVFGGIFRPVRLVSHPPESIDHLAFDPRHDGSITLRARLVGFEEGSEEGREVGRDGPATLRLVIEDLETGIAVDRPLEVPVPTPSPPTAETSTEVVLEGSIDGIEPWSAETPRLYRARAELVRNGAVLHRVDTRIGFRTVELRNLPAATLEPLREVDPSRIDLGEPPRFETGLFVNGRRVLLRGINRHAFWPTTGRAIDPAVDRRDAEILKTLHVNAVRASHYPPNEAFLDAADELGLYVIDELAGWHDAYGTRVGRGLVREMVERDVNRPSIVLWANGNEGGWNPALDETFRRLDPQRRPVFWPDAVQSGIEAKHYPTFEELRERLDPRSPLSRWRAFAGGALGDAMGGRVPLVLPTEMLHALYDGGGGAGLETFWREIERSPLALGGFLWAFFDEAIVRTDRPDRSDDDPEAPRLDTDGNHAPDGIVGPYREPSGSAAALREIWAPVRVHATDGPALVLHNRFDHLDLARCRLTWRLETRPALGTSSIGGTIDRGEMELPSAPPGTLSRIELPPSLLTRGDADDGIVTVRVLDPSNRVVGDFAAELRDGRLAELGRGAPTIGIPRDGPTPRVEESDGRWIAEAGTTRLVLDPSTGALLDLSRRGSAEDGEAPVPLGSPRPAFDNESEVRAGAIERLDDPPGLRIRSTDSTLELTWRLWPSGWVELSWRADDPSFDGLLLPFLDPSVLETLRWWGLGPTRVWGNRLHGRWGLWSRDAATTTPPRWGHEPTLRGFYAAAWATITTSSGSLTVVPRAATAGDPPPFLGVLSPLFPDDSKDAVARVPSVDGLSVWRRPPAIGTKFHPVEDLEPPTAFASPFEGTLWLYPGPVPTQP